MLVTKHFLATIDYASELFAFMVVNIMVVRIVNFG